MSLCNLEVILINIFWCTVFEYIRNCCLVLFHFISAIIHFNDNVITQIVF